MLAANSANEALEILHTRQLTPVGVYETLARGGKKRKAARRGRVRSADLGAVCWQLSTMLEGGMTITAALDIIAEDTENLQLRHILQQARTKVSEGKLLSEGLNEFPQVFNRLALAIVIAGETGGDLGKAIRTLAEHFDGRDRIAKKIRGAVSYPIFVLSLITVIVIGIMGLIVPRFRMIFTQLGGKLPAFTQTFMGIYDVLCHNVLYVIVAVVALVGRRDPAGQDPGRPSIPEQSRPADAPVRQAVLRGVHRDVLQDRRHAAGGGRARARGLRNRAGHELQRRDRLGHRPGQAARHGRLERRPGHGGRRVLPEPGGQDGPGRRGKRLPGGHSAKDQRALRAAASPRRSTP